MKAVRVHDYGDTDQLKLDEVAVPEIGPGQVLIENFYSSVNPIDWKMRNGSLKLFYALKFPETLGFDIAGTVSKVGANVTRFKVGDEVYARSSIKEGRAYAEFVAQDEEAVALKPPGMSFPEAAAVPLAALTGVQALRDRGGLKAGQTVLINGASGGVGVYAVQIAKAMGARVVAVCGTSNIDFVRGLGADEIIDYKTTPPLSLEQNYDVIFDCVASLSYRAAKKRLTAKGAYITTLPRPEIFIAKFLSSFTSKSAEFIVVMASGEDLEYLNGLIAAGKLKSHIDSEFALADIARAHERSEGGRVRGKIVVKIR